MTALRDADPANKPTASADVFGTEAVERIRREAVKPWRIGVQGAISTVDGVADHLNTALLDPLLERLRALLAEGGDADHE